MRKRYPPYHEAELIIERITNRIGYGPHRSTRAQTCMSYLWRLTSGLVWDVMRDVRNEAAYYGRFFRARTAVETASPRSFRVRVYYNLRYVQVRQNFLAGQPFVNDCPTLKQYKITMVRKQINNNP